MVTGLPDTISEDKVPKSIVKLLKFFIDTNRYGLVDRMALALSPESVETALYDMLRLVDSLEQHRIIVKIATGNKEYTTSCCEYGEDLGYGMKGVVKEVIQGPGNLENKSIYCVPCPPKPTRNELAEFLEKVREDLTIARKASILAFGYESGGEN